MKKAETSNLLLLGNSIPYSETDRSRIKQQDLSIAYKSQDTLGSITGMVEIVYSGHYFVEVVKATPQFGPVLQYIVPFKGVEEESRLLRQVCDKGVE